MGGKKASPHLTALRAQRLLGVIAFGIAPAATAGLMAGGHLGSAGRGALVFVAVMIASWVLGHRRYPLHLMPLAAFAVRALVPVFGVGLALAAFALAGNPESIGVWLPP